MRPLNHDFCSHIFMVNHIDVFIFDLWCVCVFARIKTASLRVVGAISLIVRSKTVVPFMTTTAIGNVLLWAVSSNCQIRFCHNLQLVSAAPFEYFSQCFLLGRPVYLHRARTLKTFVAWHTFLKHLCPRQSSGYPESSRGIQS